jgi:hypothetical protein
MNTHHVLAGLCLLGMQSMALAAVTATEALRLSRDLTPVGAEIAAGKQPAGIQPQADISQPLLVADDEDFEDIVDPPTTVAAWSATHDPAALAAEKPLFSINQANAGRYRDNLTASHFALIQAYPNDFFMKVYPSHRSVRWPDAIERETRANATRCTLKGTDELLGCKVGIPFPIPKSGAEVMWNHKLRWRGDALSRINNQLVVQPDGKYQVTRTREDFAFDYANVSGGAEQGSVFRYVSEVLSPSRLAGNFVLIHERFGTGSLGRKSWALAAGTTRARRESRAAFDTPYEGSDGLAVFDQIDMFNGSLEQFDWKLVGKKELFIPYNSVQLAAASAQADRILKPSHLDQDLLRYELHRVWIVDATLKASRYHSMRKRRFYVDEDSWSIVTVDVLDNFDQPYQFQEAHLVYLPGAKRPEYAAEVIYNRQSTRYLVTGLRLADPAANDKPSFASDWFESGTLARRAVALGKR